MFLVSELSTDSPELRQILIHWIQEFIGGVKRPLREVKHLSSSSAELRIGAVRRPHMKC